MPSYITIANTNFPQADGPIDPAHWSVFPGGGAFPTMAVRSNLAQATTNTLVAGDYWSGDPFPLAGNQWAEAALHQLTGDTANFIDIGILVAVASLAGGFFVDVNPDGSGNLIISLFDNTSGLDIGQTFTKPFVANAILRLEFIGGVLTLKYNGVTLAAYGGLSSHNADVGVPCILVGENDVLTNATASHFAAGTIVPPAAGSSNPGGLNFRYLTDF